MMICGSMQLKVTHLELSIPKSDRFGQFISMVICHRNEFHIRKSHNALSLIDANPVPHLRCPHIRRFLLKVYCYAKKTGDSPENNSNWQCYSNGKWSPSNGVVTCSSAARSKIEKMSLFITVLTFCSALKNESQQVCCPLMTVKIPGQKWPLTLERDHWSYQRDEWIRYFNWAFDLNLFLYLANLVS